MRDIRDLASKAASKHGLLTTDEFLDAGWTHGELRGLLDRSVVERLRTDVYRLAGATPSWQQDLLSACLTPGPIVTPSHRSALRLWAMRTVDDDLEVTVLHPANRHLKGVTTHRSRDLIAADITWVDGIPVTNPVRTICDAGSIFPDHEVQRILDHAVATRLVLPSDLWGFRHRVGRQGRNGVGPLHRALLALPPDAARTESGPELALLRLCARHGLPAPTPQVPVVVKGRHYRIDLAYPRRRLALEYDGVDAHTSHDRFVGDRRRQNDLVLTGWTVLRYSADDLAHRPSDIARQIRTALGATDLAE